MKKKRSFYKRNNSKCSSCRRLNLSLRGAQAHFRGGIKGYFCLRCKRGMYIFSKVSKHK